ncbi:MAG TPA: LptF/LptG family permease [Gemmatimonadales bacterium]|nr:LptF/LptG family permease [Gemmatimonadales bacterium]
MRLLSRYLLRQLAAPFLFALGALTSLMLLSQIAKKFGALVGKGLPWGVIAEVFALSVPFIVAMTLPMAVLLAVLYAFSHLAADNEITAMRASGISVYQILAPVLVWGVVMSGLNFLFVDQVLPRTNARLRGLLIDIGRKKPTFELREQVINEVPPSEYFLRAGRIDAATGRLKDVTIYDVGGDASSRRIIYADSGLMAYAEGQTDLSLRLYDGAIHQYRPTDPMAFQLTYYKVNDIRVKNVFDELVRNSSETIRGDREMSTCEMLAVVQEARGDQHQAAREQVELLQGDLRKLLDLPPLPPAVRESTTVRLPGYCRLVDRLQAIILPKTAEAQTPAQQPAPAPAPILPRQAPRQGGKVPLQVPGKAQGTRPAKPLLPAGRPNATPVPRPPFAQAADSARPSPAAPPAPRIPRVEPDHERPVLSNWAQVATATDRIRDADRRADRFLVEIHKKWAISLACVSFVIIGIVMALRFPRGGIGLVIGGGLLVFSVHYVGLTAGESLADRGFVSPWAAMWTPNIVLTVLGLIGLVRVSRESGSTRGGDFQEVVEGIRYLFRRLRGRASTSPR